MEQPTVASKRKANKRQKPSENMPSKKTHEVDYWTGNFITGHDLKIYFREIQNEEFDFDF